MADLGDTRPPTLGEKKKEITVQRKVSRASKTKPGPLLAQSLVPLLILSLMSFFLMVTLRKILNENDKDKVSVNLSAEKMLFYLTDQKCFVDHHPKVPWYWSEWDSNSRLLDCESNMLTTRPRSLLA